MTVQHLLMILSLDSEALLSQGLRLDALLYMMPSGKPCRLSSGGQLLDSTDMSPCVLCFNSWSHRLSPKLPRRRTRDILMRSSQHRPSLSHLPDKVAAHRRAHFFFSFHFQRNILIWGLQLCAAVSILIYCAIFCLCHLIVEMQKVQQVFVTL